MNFDDTQFIPGTQYGSNEGGVCKNSKGEKFYVKRYADDNQARVEVLAANLYQMMGINTVSPFLATIKGKIFVCSPWNSHLRNLNYSEFSTLSDSQAEQIARMFYAAVLTKNWDIVGLQYDNILLNTNTQDLYALDTGGAFHFRARGETKDYDDDIRELQSLKTIGSSSSVFNLVFAEHPSVEVSGTQAVTQLDDRKVAEQFEASELLNWQEMYKTFNTRKEKLISVINS